MADDLSKVSPGQPLRIPAGAYNAFIDAAADLRFRQGRTQAIGGQAVDPIQRGLCVVPVLNESLNAIEPYRALAITGVLVEPDAGDQERTFQGRTPLKAALPTDQSDMLAFVVALEPFGWGEIGACVLKGITAARVNVMHERDMTCQLAPQQTTLVSSPMGGIPMLWKESGTGEKWALIEIGRPSTGQITAILGAAQPIPGQRNRWRYPWVEARLQGNSGAAEYLRYVPVPGGLSSRDGAGNEDPERMALNRFESHHLGAIPYTFGYDGLLGVGPVCKLPGVAPHCPPNRYLELKLVPIPQDVCVQLICERNLQGDPVWVFEAMTLIEMSDPIDDDRKFNLYIPGSL